MHSLLRQSVFDMRATTSIASTTWLDRFPTEVIFMIFDYLSNNDIIYIFFHFNQRFNNLLLQNQRYLNYLELPTTNSNTWKNILLSIRLQIQFLEIKTIDLSFPITLFPNLKSIIISSPYGFSDEAFQSIIKSHQFQNLQSFKLKENNSSSIDRFCYENHSNTQYSLLKNVMNYKNPLKTVNYSSFAKTCAIHGKINLNSLTLILTDFDDVFKLLVYTPNLEYLNIRCTPPYRHERSIIERNIKLKQLYLELNDRKLVQSFHHRVIDYNQLIKCINQFSSSLTCLSLNFIDMNIQNINEIPFNNIKLQQVLEVMTELKQFHLYAKSNRYNYPRPTLSRFQNQFWFDRNWSFGIHGEYFYTLPFNFDYLYEFYGDFNDVQSSNPEILITNPRIWYNVKYIDLRPTSAYDLHFLEELKMKMPKLTYIKFRPSRSNNDLERTEDLSVDKNEKEKMHVTLNHVTTIQFNCGSIESTKEWLTYALPNLNHLILSFVDLPLADDQLIQILNKRIQRLDINTVNSPLKRLTEISYNYFSNVQHIYFELFYDDCRRSQWYANIVKKILKNFKSLQTLIIYNFEQNKEYMERMTRDLGNLLEHSDMIEIKKNYQMKQFGPWIFFLKEEFGNGGMIQSEARKFSFFSRKKQ